MNCSGLGAVNAAVEGLTRGLALELGPRLRVNRISPGMARTEAYAGRPEDKREAMYRDTGHLCRSGASAKQKRSPTPRPLPPPTPISRAK